MKKKALFTVALLFLVTVFLTIFFTEQKNSWICKDGEWVRQGSPKVSQPKTVCPGKNSAIVLPTIPPDSTVVNFYNWLMKNTDALSNGSYKKSPYLTDALKKTVPQLVIAAKDTAYNPF